MRLLLAFLIALPAFGLPLYRDSLDNGLIVLTYEDHRAPAVALRLVCRSGAASDPENASGTANLAADLLFAGTQSMDADSVAATLEFLGARQESGASYDFSSIGIRALSEHLDIVLGLLADAARDATIPEAEFERERAAALNSARRSWDSPNRAAAMLFDRLLYGNLPYARPAQGDTADLARITADRIRAFHRTHWRPNNCFLVVVGDVERSDFLARVRSALAGWEPAPVARPEAGAPEWIPGLRVLLVSRPDLNQSYVIMGHPGLAVTAPDMLAARLMSFVLGGSAIASRLGESVRVEGGLAYDVRCWFERYLLPGAFRSTVQTSDPAEAIRRMRAEFVRMRDSGPTEKETETARRYYTGSYPLGYADTPGKLYEVTIAEANGFGPAWLDEFPDKVRALTREDLARAARERLRPEDLLVVVLGPVTREELDLPGVQWLD